MDVRFPLRSTKEEVRQIKDYAASIGKDIIIEADGGINDTNIADCANAGIDIAVSGTGVFKVENASAAIENLKQLCEKE